MKNITDTLVKIIYLNIIPSALLGVFQISSTIYTALFALVFAFQIFLISRTLGRNSIYLSRNQMYVLILIFAIQIISNLYSAAIYDNFNLNETLVIFSVTLNIYYFIICLFNVNIDMNQLYSFFYKVICIGIFACIVNFLLNFHELLSVSAITSAYSVSFSSFFANRNTFGILMLISIISNKYLIESRHYRFAKYIQILFFINILLTLSRTSIAGVVVFYFAYYLINIFGKNSSFNINKVLIGLVGICLGTFSLYLLITNQALIDRITILFIRTKNFGTAAGRTDVWKNGIEIGLNNNFWFGLGRYRALELNLELYQNTLPYFHSIYVETFVTYGFLGLSILISYFCNILSKTAKSSFIHKKITLASLICFFVISIFESTTRFSIGYADTISLIFFFSIPILIGNLHD